MGQRTLWQLPTEVFDEGVDINTVLALIDATILVVMGFVLASLRGKRDPGSAA